MLRECDINEISDGKRYQSEDLVKAGCNDCLGCSDCCHGMGNSIVLDPRDIYDLTVLQGKTFEQLLDTTIELNVVDGIILPNLKMQRENDCCAYLSEDGRCSIHLYRPGICRLFPLGRIYENDSFSYFLQGQECKNQKRSKVRIRKWIDLPDFKEYEKFVLAWHDYVKCCVDLLQRVEDEKKKLICINLLQTFFLTPYQKEDFYPQFYTRLLNEDG